MNKGNQALKSKTKSFSFLRRGKVRDVYDAGDGRHLIIIASDRISAFDHILPDPITGKGIILTQLSNFWFDKTRDLVPNHIVDKEPKLDDWKDDEYWKKQQLKNRAVLVKKTRPLPLKLLSGDIWQVPAGRNIKHLDACAASLFPEA